MNYQTIDNSLANFYLTKLQDKNLTPAAFREAMRLVTYILLAAAFKKKPTVEKAVETPLGMSAGLYLGEKQIVAANTGTGNVMVNAFLDFFPATPTYYFHLTHDTHRHDVLIHNAPMRIPSDIQHYTVWIVDPIIATGRNVRVMIDYFQSLNVKNVAVLCLIATPEGLALLQSEFANVKVYTINSDQKLAESHHAYPGFGDIYERIYGFTFSS